MHLSQWAYRADFVVYPVLVVTAALLSPWHAAFDVLPWLAAAGVGLLAWTAIEYALHRLLFHRVPPFRELHGAHHSDPRALIGTPTWLSAGLFLAAWFLLARIFPARVADGAAAGLMGGYLLYAFTHDAVHHRRPRPGSWLHRARFRHALHHRRGAHCNYGVSIGLWDAVMRSSATARGAPADASAPPR